MKLVECWVPQDALDALEMVIAEGTYPNRAETIRVALRDFIRANSQSLSTLDPSCPVGPSSPGDPGDPLDPEPRVPTGGVKRKIHVFMPEPYWDYFQSFLAQGLFAGMQEMVRQAILDLVAREQTSRRADIPSRPVDFR